MGILTEGEKLERGKPEIGDALCAIGMEGGDRNNGWFLRASRGASAGRQYSLCRLQVHETIRKRYAEHTTAVV